MTSLETFIWNFRVPEAFDAITRSILNIRANYLGYLYQHTPLFSPVSSPQNFNLSGTDAGKLFLSKTIQLNLDHSSSPKDSKLIETIDGNSGWKSYRINGCQIVTGPMVTCYERHEAMLPRASRMSMKLYMMPCPIHTYDDNFYNFENMYIANIVHIRRLWQHQGNLPLLPHQLSRPRAPHMFSQWYDKW